MRRRGTVQRGLFFGPSALVPEDLYATVDVQLPRDLTPDQKKLFEELRKLETGTKNSAA